MPLESQWLGTVEYSTGLGLQLESVRAVQSGRIPRVLGLEHTGVITLGRRSDPERDLLWSSSRLSEAGIATAAVDRGGEATLHAPGQLVIYPIISLKERGLGVRDYVGLLEQASIKCLASFGVTVRAKGCEPGLYSEHGKMVFFGIRVDHGVTLHGVSINVRNDLDLFNSIRSCGKVSENFDSLELSGVNTTPSEVFSRWVRAFTGALDGGFPHN